MQERSKTSKNTTVYGQVASTEIEGASGFDRRQLGGDLPAELNATREEGL